MYHPPHPSAATAAASASAHVLPTPSMAMEPLMPGNASTTLQSSIKANSPKIPIFTDDSSAAISAPTSALSTPQQLSQFPLSRLFLRSRKSSHSTPAPYLPSPRRHSTGASGNPPSHDLDSKVCSAISKHSTTPTFFPKTTHFRPILNKDSKKWSTINSFFADIH